MRPSSRSQKRHPHLRRTSLTDRGLASTLVITEANMNLGSLSRCNGSLCFVKTAATALALLMAFALAIIATPAAQAQNLTVLYSFTGGADGEWPVAGLAFDAAGNLYGTAAFTYGLDEGPGTVFELRHSGGIGWVFTTLYSFTGGSDGAGPASRVTIAPDGTLLSTTTSGGLHICSDEYCGTFFRLRPSPTAPKTVLAPWNETVLY